LNEVVRNNRAVLLLIAGIPLTIILAASWLWYYVASGRLDLVDLLGTANRGTLLTEPVDIRTLGLEDTEGGSFDPEAGEKPLWRIFVPVAGGCDDACLELLHYTRQIHVAMGKYQNRIERLIAVDFAPGPEMGAVLAEEPAPQLLYTSASALGMLLATQPTDVPAPAYYVVDPHGWVILSYAVTADGKDVMADLKFLLKNSNG